MADPVTMAVVGATAGAALNKDDPLKGALLGAAGGYGGGALLGTSAIGGTAATAGAGLTGSANAFIPGVQGGFGALGGGGATTLTGMTAANPGILSSTMAGFGKDMAAVGGFAQQNPVLSEIAAGTAINSMQAPPPPPSGGMQQGNAGLLEMMAQYGQMPQKPFTQQNRISLL